MKDKPVYSEAELRKAATRAVKKVIAMAKQEPSVILFVDSDENESEQPLEEISEWLFTRRKDDGYSGN